MNGSREHILFTSLTLFMQKSFKDVTMKDIVNNTGLSKGAFYHYFSSKEQVFAEVINHYFAGLTEVEYEQYPQRSLKAFYTAILTENERNRSAMQKTLQKAAKGILTGNVYYLIFDAIRILPDFKAKLETQHKEELKAWKKVIGTAKTAREIKTDTQDEVVARLFLNLGDGTNLNLVLNNKTDKETDELKTLWDNLYQLLQP